MEHVYKSIQIICILEQKFPKLVVHNIRKYLMLAIDLNGYRRDELINLIKNHIHTKIDEVNKYTKKHYGKNRRYIQDLKVYQLINVIHHFRIVFPLRRYPRNVYKEVSDKYNHSFDINTQSCIIIPNRKMNRITKFNITNNDSHENYLVIEKITNKCVYIQLYIRDKLKLYHSSCRLTHNEFISYVVIYIYKYEDISKSECDFSKIYKWLYPINNTSSIQQETLNYILQN